MKVGEGKWEFVIQYKQDLCCGWKGKFNQYVLSFLFLSLNNGISSRRAPPPPVSLSLFLLLFPLSGVISCGCSPSLRWQRYSGLKQPCRLPVKKVKWPSHSPFLCVSFFSCAPKSLVHSVSQKEEKNGIKVTFSRRFPLAARLDWDICIFPLTFPPLQDQFLSKVTSLSIANSIGHPTGLLFCFCTKRLFVDPSNKLNGSGGQEQKKHRWAPLSWRMFHWYSSSSPSSPLPPRRKARKTAPHWADAAGGQSKQEKHRQTEV